MYDNAQTLNSLISSGSEDAINFISSLNVDEFRDLINKPDFFYSVADRLTFLNYNSMYVENINVDKLKLIIDNIMENDKDIILNNTIMSRRFLKWLKNDKVSNLLNYFLEIIPSEYINNIVERLILNNLNLNNLSFNDNNKNIISEYISRCSNDKLKEIFDGIYNSANDDFNWIEFLIDRLLVEEKLELFLEYYKDLIEKSDNFTTFKDKERLVLLLISLVNVILEKIDGDEYLLNDFTNNLFDKLGLDNSKEITDNDFNKILSSPSNKLVSYMNDLVGSWLNDTSNISTKILKSPILIKYILPIYVVNYGKNVFLKETLDESKSYDEVRKKLLNDEELNSNLINNFSSTILIKFFSFDNFESESNEIINTLKVFLSRYLSYERAIFFVDKLKIDETKKVDIINEVYQGRNINDIKQEKENLISRCNEELLSLSDEVSDLFKSLLPELIELQYDEKLFKKLKCNSLKLDKLEYLFVYLSLYFKYGCKNKGMDYNEYYLNFIPKHCSIGGTATYKQVIVNYEDYLEDKDYIIWQNVDYIETTNHEKTHLWQDKMFNVISIDALMIGLEKNLIFDSEYYNTNYYNVYTEVHARIVSFYEIYKYLEEINPYVAYQYLERNKHLVDENDDEKSDNEEVVTFIKDRKKAKSIEYFANLINTFLEKTSKYEISDLRKGFKTLELITDEDGRFYDVNEIEERMNSIKSYSTNDIEFNPIDRDTKLFYIKYLHNLRYCLDNGLINFNYDTKEKR